MDSDRAMHPWAPAARSRTRHPFIDPHTLYLARKRPIYIVFFVTVEIFSGSPFKGTVGLELPDNGTIWKGIDQDKTILCFQ